MAMRRDARGEAVGRSCEARDRSVRGRGRILDVDVGDVAA